ncbi:MAG TPA: helix-turn-helix domain-containing protein [Nocardioides sp.]|uniref:TetR/AcrR family transcriptional regulator n=1 Tax=Nocardioides sp. TaxID=35761 RepID=UPI002B5450F3|nr:helix-turn-helix domain-containing protein [Nocardioides sp.]HQR25480.1 helix-turn-helix domain-containing protein [Nocardioides sp.]
MDARHVVDRGAGLVTAAPQEERRRPYRSARRQQQAAQTRALVLAAATVLFAERGWSSTGMRDIATEAGVAVETVYASFGSKPELLLAAIDVGVVGDAEPVPLSHRPEFAAIGVGSLTDRIGAAAQLVSGINQRTWGLRRALTEAAGSEPQLAAKLHDLENSRRADIRQGVEMVLGRPVDDDVLDGLWVVMGADVYHLLTQIGERSVAAYESWLAVTVERLLIVSGTEGTATAATRREP